MHFCEKYYAGKPKIIKTLIFHSTRSFAVNPKINITHF